VEHAEVRKKLSEYLDNASAPEERAGIEAHLLGCDRCRAALAELQKTIGHLRSLPREEPPAWLATRIMARVRSEAEKPNLWHRLFHPLHIKIPIEALALVALCVTGYFIARTTGPTIPLTSPQLLEQGAPPRPDQTSVTAGEGKAARGRAPFVPATTSPAPEPPAKAPDGPTAVPGFAPPPRLQEPAPASPAMPPAPSAKSLSSFPPGGMQERIRPEAAGEERDVLPEMVRQPAAKARKALKAEAAGGYGARDEAAALASAPRTIMLRAADPASAGNEVARAVADLGGTLVHREPGIARERLLIRIGSNRIGTLLSRMEAIGRIAKKPAPTEERTGIMELVVEVEPDF